MRALFTYTGTTPGADSNDYTLFDSTSLPAGVTLHHLGFKRLVLVIDNSHAGTVKAYRKRRSSSTWLHCDTYVVPARVNGSQNTKDYICIGDEDVKLVWTNGGSAQTTWVVDVEGDKDRALS